MSTISAPRTAKLSDLPRLQHEPRGSSQQGVLAPHSDARLCSHHLRGRENEEAGARPLVATGRAGMTIVRIVTLRRLDRWVALG
jgi:hypothetical protein